MATTFNPGGQSPNSLSRTLERVFEDAQHSGEVNLAGRKLKDYPKVASKYDLADSTSVDLSKNRLTEVPTEVCDYSSLERLSCYHNVIRCIPQALVQLQALVHLNLSRNQLCNIPPFICQLRALEVLLACNNRLVSLPEEIGKLDRLMDLDVSCNEISQLPAQIADLESLRSLNVRRNLLVELPTGLCRLHLQKLDFSGNKISAIPWDYRNMESLDEIFLDNNPLVCPPASICTKGRVHIMKYLQNEAIREDRKRGLLNENDVKKNFRKSSSIQPSLSDEFRYMESPCDRRKRHTVDSGYSTTDSTDKSRWSPSETRSEADMTLNPLNRAFLWLENQSLLSTHSDHEEPGVLALRAAESVKEQRQEREAGLQRRVAPPNGSVNSPRLAARHNLSPLAMSPPAASIAPSMTAVSPSMTAVSPPVTSVSVSFSPPVSSLSPQVAPPSGSPLGVRSVDSDRDPSVVDEFTRELQRQRADYEARKKMAGKIRQELEKEEVEEKERDERRRAAIRLQEEQKALMERQREEARRRGETSMNSPVSTSSMSSSSSHGDQQDVAHRKIPHSQSFKDERKSQPGNNNNNYRRTMSDSNYRPGITSTTVRESSTEYQWRKNGVPESSPESSQGVDPMRSPMSPQTVMNHNYGPEDEFRQRHERLVSQQRHEAHMVRRIIEDEKERLKYIQKEAVYNYISMRRPHGALEDEEKGFSFSRDSTPNSSFNGSAMNRMNSQSNLPPGCQKALDAMSSELNSTNPGFTIRRHLQQAEEEMEKIEQLRTVIESRLKVTLPEDLPAALKDGVVLCHLANHIRPRSVSSIHVPSPAVPKLTMAKCRRNVENFLEACRRIGVDQELLCACDDITEELRPLKDMICPPMAVLDEKGCLQLATTVNALIKCGINPRQSAV